MDKQPLNTGEQKDMTEFFTDLIGKIEEMSSVLVRKLCVVKPHGNERNIVGQRLQHYWVLHVASVCTLCCKLLRVVGSCCSKLETGQTFETIPPNISLVS